VLRERVIVRGTAPYDGVEGGLVWIEPRDSVPRDRPRAQPVAFGCRGVAPNGICSLMGHLDFQVSGSALWP